MEEKKYNKQQPGKAPNFFFRRQRKKNFDQPLTVSLAAARYPVSAASCAAFCRSNKFQRMAIIAAVFGVVILSFSLLADHRVKASADTTPPKITSPLPSGTVSESKLFISVQTDEAATCRMGNKDVAYDQLCKDMGTTGGTSHQSVVCRKRDLANGSYTFYIRCKDKAGNKSSKSTKVTFKVDRGDAGEPDDDDSGQTDIVSPIITNPKPSGTVATPVVTLSVKTNEKAACHYATTDTEYDAMNFEFNTSNGLSHTASKTLSQEGKYTYYVRCEDEVGNKSPTSTIIYFTYSTGGSDDDSDDDSDSSDNVPPKISDLEPSGVVSSMELTMSLKTDEKAICKYGSSDTAYSSMENVFFSADGLSHQKALNFSGPGKHVYYVRCKDNNGNINTSSKKIEFEIKTGGDSGDSTPPALSGLKASVKGNIATLVLTTSESAACKWDDTDCAHVLMANKFSQTGKTSHSTQIEFKQKGKYTLYVRCKDPSGNENSKGSKVTVDILQDEDAGDDDSSGGDDSGDNDSSGDDSDDSGDLTDDDDTGGDDDSGNDDNDSGNDDSGDSSGDTVPPKITSVNKTVDNNKKTALVTVKTDEFAICKYDLKDASYSSMEKIFSRTGSKDHSTTVSGLKKGKNTVYIRCEDEEGNMNSSSRSVVIEIGGSGGGNGKSFYVWQSVETGTKGGFPNVSWYAGYSFTAAKDGFVTELCGYFDGRNNVALYDSGFNLLVSASVASAEKWNCKNIKSVRIKKGKSYYVIGKFEKEKVFFRYQCCNPSLLPKKSGNATIKYGIWQTANAPFGRNVKKADYILFGLVDAKISDNDSGSSETDSQAPVITDPQPSGTISNNQPTLSVKTDEKAICKYGSSDGSFDKMAVTFNTADNIIHSIDVGPLSGGKRIYYVRCMDESGNKNNVSIKISFEMKEKPVQDKNPPKISDSEPAGTVKQNSPTISVITDENAVCKFETKDGSYNKMSGFFDTTGKKIHTAVVGPLNDGTHVYYVRCKDAAGNVNTSSAEIEFDVEAKANDTTPPQISNITVSPDSGEAGTDFIIKAKVSDKSGIKSVKATINDSNGSSISIITLYDDGKHNDGKAGDGVFARGWDSSGVEADDYSVDIKATDINSNSSTEEGQAEFTVEEPDDGSDDDDNDDIADDDSDDDNGDSGGSDSGSDASGAQGDIPVGAGGSVTNGMKDEIPKITDQDLTGPGIAYSTVAYKVSGPSQAVTLRVPMPVMYEGSQAPIYVGFRADNPDLISNYKVLYRDKWNPIMEVSVKALQSRESVTWEWGAYTLQLKHKECSDTKAVSKDKYPSEVQEWLKASASVQSDNSQIKSKAQSLMGSSGVQTFAKAAAQYIYNNQGGSQLDALSALNQGSASCTASGNLGAGLMRGGGFPGRVLANYPTWYHSGLATHYNTEYYVPGCGWQWFDGMIGRRIQPYDQVVVSLVRIDDENKSMGSTNDYAVAAVPYDSIIRQVNGRVSFEPVVGGGKYGYATAGAVATLSGDMDKAEKATRGMWIKCFNLWRQGKDISKAKKYQIMAGKSVSMADYLNNISLAEKECEGGSSDPGDSSSNDDDSPEGGSAADQDGGLAAECKTLVNNGLPKDKLDFVFIPCNYDSSELGDFESSVDAHVKKMLSLNPYTDAEYMKKINVHIYPKKGLTCEYDACSNLDYSSTFENLGDACKADMTIVFNKTGDGHGCAAAAPENGEGYGLAFITPEGYGEISHTLTAHESGHAIFGLHDEYVYSGYENVKGSMSKAINCDDDPACSKWKGVSGTSCYKGCNYGLNYRSKDICIMRSVDPSKVTAFCPVCEKHMKKFLDRNYK